MRKLLITVLAILISFVQIAYGKAAPKSRCDLLIPSVAYECQVSISLYDDLKYKNPKSHRSGGWVPTDDEKSYLENEFGDFSNHLCQAAHGYVRIAKIYVQAKESVSGKLDSHIHFLKSATLYRDLKRDRLSISAGAKIDRNFPDSNSINLKTGISDLRTNYMRGQDPTITTRHPYIGEVIAHEIGHSLLGLADEYRSDQGPNLCNPHKDDMPRNTLMSDHTASAHNRTFSNPDHYEPPVIPSKYRTAQERCFVGDSAWESLLKPIDPCYKGIPNKYKILKNRYISLVHLNTGSTFPKDCLKPIVVPNATSCPATEIEWITTITTDPFINVIMVIDDSGSMIGDPLVMAQKAANEMIDILLANRGTEKIRISIVGFDDSARTEIRLTSLENERNANSIREAIKRLIADGGTDFQNALDAARSIITFNENITPDEQYIVSMVSDGAAALPTNLNFFQSEGIPVYTIGINQNVDKTVLKKIADQTGGEFRFGSQNLLPSLVRNILRDTAVINSNQIGGLGSFSKAASSSPTTHTSMVAETISADFILRWDDSAILDNFTLKQPNGILVNEAYANSTDTVRYFLGATQAIYSIDFPIPGTWEVFIDGTGNFDYELALESVITADFITEPTRVIYPEPIPLEVGVSGDGPIINADVIAEITLPSTGTVLIRLVDDGNSPDRTADDGIYAGTLGQYSQDGIYEIKVTVNNLEGNAQLDDSNVAFSMGSRPSTPTVAPIFQRFLNTQIEVTGTKSQNSTKTAVLITPDNTLYWGMISQPTQIDWYRFSAIQGTTYFIRTSQLLGTSSTEMITDVKLYELDSSAVIESSTGNQNVPISNIEWITPKSGDYLISVEHANRGIGNYAIRVGNYDFHNRMAPPETPSSGGGGADYILLLLLLILVITFRQKKISCLKSSQSIKCSKA